MGKIILNSKNLIKSYQNGDKRLVVLNGINIELETGTITTIIGESGSGKSTLLNVLSSLDTFDSGELLIENEEISSLNEKKYVPNFLIDKDIEVNDLGTLLNGLKLVGDYLDKTILRPNNLNYPNSRLLFLNTLK